MTSTGIESANFRLVTQCLYRVPHLFLGSTLWLWSPTNSKSPQCSNFRLMCWPFRHCSPIFRVLITQPFLLRLGNTRSWLLPNFPYGPNVRSAVNPVSPSCFHTNNHSAVIDWALDRWQYDALAEYALLVAAVGNTKHPTRWLSRQIQQYIGRITVSPHTSSLNYRHHRSNNITKVRTMNIRICIRYKTCQKLFIM
jgi:hypothetical protein